MFSNKKELKKVWMDVMPSVVPYLPNYLELTDYNCSMGWDKETYIGIQLNETWIFFIFDLTKSSIAVFSHDKLGVDMQEIAALIRSMLIHVIFNRTTRIVKASKAE